MFTHNVYYKYDAAIMTCMFSLTNVAHIYETRQSDKGFYLPRVRLNIAKNCITIYGIELWNSLPQKFKFLASLNKFKCNLHTHLLLRYI